MSSKDKAIANHRGLGLADQIGRWFALAGLLLVGVPGLPGLTWGQVLEVPVRDRAAVQAPSLSAPVPDQAIGPGFQAQWERSQRGPGPEFQPGFAGDGGVCPECGQSGADTLPRPWYPGARLADGLRLLLEPPGRFRGPGRPLLRESWLYRPYSVGWFMGYLHGGTLIDDWISQKGGYLGGFRLGWDFHYYWGCEMRLAWGYAELADSERAITAQIQADNMKGLAPDDPFRQRFDVRRDSVLEVVWDFEFLYYPWGDSAWRPYFLAGLGYARIKFEDRLSEVYESGALSLPLGVGLKYRWNDWLVLRAELTDTLLIPGRDINMVNEISFTGGLEVRFGGPRKAYWPWNPGLHYW